MQIHFVARFQFETRSKQPIRMLPAPLFLSLQLVVLEACYCCCFVRSLACARNLRRAASYVNFESHLNSVYRRWLEPIRARPCAHIRNVYSTPASGWLLCALCVRRFNNIPIVSGFNLSSAAVRRCYDQRLTSRTYEVVLYYSIVKCIQKDCLFRR